MKYNQTRNLKGQLYRLENAHKNVDREYQGWSVAKAENTVLEQNRSLRFFSRMPMDNKNQTVQSKKR